ncbi:unnamed protein product [Echinostoma caproni]|uniref:Ovule protein n=1 Tax=Echinostoma caproni TaxID=27848 RepID=A0A183AXN9_9TREM|nr:unnamed protein product [Echinostoma caproni]
MSCPKFLGTHLKNDPSLLTSFSSQPRLIPDASCLRRSSNITQQFTIKAKDSEAIGILKAKSPFHLVAFYVLTLYQIGQQAALAKTLETFNLPLCVLLI